MPVYRPLGENLLSSGEFQARSATEEIEQPFDLNQPFDINAVEGTGTARPFAPIDFGKPLSVVIRRIYTGRFPEKKLFGGRKPMLLSSSVKDINTTSAGARAINILKRDVGPKSAFTGVGAAEEGTSLIYYSPAVTSAFITVGVTMIFEDFDQDLFDRASKLFSAAAGVPIFVPASAYLLAASTVVKLAGNAGSQILNGHPALDENIQLDFSFGGGGLPQPGYWIFSAGPIDGTQFVFDPVRGLVKRSDKSPYDGDVPVVVVTIDGTAVEGVSNFTPMLAGASVLGRFFNQKENSEVAMDTILDAVKLVNDLTFRKKAEEAKSKLATLPPDSSERKRLEDAIKAFNQNISESRLQLAAAMTA